MRLIAQGKHQVWLRPQGDWRAAWRAQCAKNLLLMCVFEKNCKITRSEKHLFFYPCPTWGWGFNTYSVVPELQPSSNNIFKKDLLFYVHYRCLQTNLKRALDPTAGGCEPPCGWWGLYLEPLEEQTLLLTTKPSLLPLNHIFFKLTISTPRPLFLKVFRIL